MSASSLQIFDYLESLPGTVKKRLYQQPSTALAVFRRMLPHLAKSFVMAMLYISHPMPVTDLESWVRPESKRDRDLALSILERLHVLENTTNPGKPRSYVLTDPFVASLRLALTGGGNHNSFGVPCSTPEKNPVSIEELDNFARRQWEAVLGYMVGSTGIGITDEGVRLSQGVKALLQDGGLVVARGKKVEITKDGFAFILEEVNAQIWQVLRHYLDNAERLRMDPVDIFSFFFMLGSLELGQDYSKTSLTRTQTHMLEDLSDLGIIYQSSPSSTRFYPTRLATTLTSDASALRSVSASFDNALRSADGRGFILLETNYRIYAYTSSNLQIAILQLFADLKVRYPNMVSGRITRSSIRQAIQMGITSDQIISFLKTHAHPEMRTENPVLPLDVIDAIQLWQNEKERMKTTPGFLFRDFLNAAEFEGPCKYAEEIGVLIWKSESRRMFFVTRHEQVAAYLKNRSKKGV